MLIRNGLEQIYLMNTDGTGVEPLTPVEVKTIDPNWNPDSKSIAYCTDDDLKPPKKNPVEIYSIEIVSRKITKLIDGGVNTYPAWSPDGKTIAFRRMLRESNSEVFLANDDGSEARNLTNDPAFDGWPAWSPDGTKIAFASNRRGSYEIYIMNPAGSGVRKVATARCDVSSGNCGLLWGRGCLCRRSVGPGFFDGVFHQAIQGAKPILPPYFLSLFIGASPVADSYLIDTQVAAGELDRDLWFETEAVFLDRDRLNHFAVEGLITGFHVGEIDVGEAIRQQS